jgi:hypothetical protein
MVSFRNFPRRSDRRSSICMIALAAAALFAGSDEAVAYKLNMEGGCDPAPGQRWDISKGPVQVRLLAESLSDYVQKRGPAAPFDIRWIDDDIKAVIEAYNSIPGSGLVLELGPGILGDRNLEEPEDDNYGEQTIVIGFTDEVSPSSNTSEAWAPGADADDCTRTRAHILFRKTDNNGVPYNWVFGPPDDTDVNGRSFSTIAQPLLAGSSQPITFLGILTHEMGHAVGLGHPSDDYAIMAQNFDTWFRGRDNVLRTRLLPDDAAGLLALYGVREARNHLDLSVTNSWYQPGGGRMDCSDEQAMIDGLERMVAELGSVPGSRRLLKGLNETLLDLEDTLQTCLDTVSGAATQSRNCLVSSRGDEWIDRAEGAFFLRHQRRAQLGVSAGRRPRLPGWPSAAPLHPEQPLDVPRRAGEGRGLAFGDDRVDRAAKPGAQVSRRARLHRSGGRQQHHRRGLPSAGRRQGRRDLPGLRSRDPARARHRRRPLVERRGPVEQRDHDPQRDHRRFQGLLISWRRRSQVICRALTNSSPKDRPCPQWGLSLDFLRLFPVLRRVGAPA